MKKDSFVIYTEKEVFLRHLNDAQKARILEAFFAYADERELPEMDAVTSVVWEVFSLDFDKNNEKYERIKKARSEAGRQHRGNQYSSDKMEQTEQNGTNGTNGTDNVNVNVDVNDNVNVPSICKDNVIDGSCENSQPTDRQEKESPKTLEERQQEFYDEVAQYVGKYDREMLRAFYDYWSEPTQNKKNPKMRKDTERTWATGGRLATWYRRQNETQNINNQQFNNKNYGNNQNSNRRNGLTDEEVIEAVAAGLGRAAASQQNNNN